MKAKPSLLVVVPWWQRRDISASKLKHVSNLRHNEGNVVNFIMPFNSIFAVYYYIYMYIITLSNIHEVDKSFNMYTFVFTVRLISLTIKSICHIVNY
jgi:hypothetical protein